MSYFSVIPRMQEESSTSGSWRPFGQNPHPECPYSPSLPVWVHPVCSAPSPNHLMKLTKWWLPVSTVPLWVSKTTSWWTVYRVNHWSFVYVPLLPYAPTCCLLWPIHEQHRSPITPFRFRSGRLFMSVNSRNVSTVHFPPGDSERPWYSEPVPDSLSYCCVPVFLLCTPSVLVDRKSKMSRLDKGSQQGGDFHNKGDSGPICTLYISANHRNHVETFYISLRFNLMQRQRCG